MVKPLFPNILLKPSIRKEGGLELPDDMKEEHGEAEVIAVYEGSKLLIGDKIIFNKYKPVQIKHRGETFYLAEEKDILALIN